MLSCALCNGTIDDISSFCTSCGAPGPGASPEQRAQWRASHATVGAPPPRVVAGPHAPAWTPPSSSSPPPPPPASSPPSNPLAGFKLPVIPGVAGMIGAVAAKYLVFAAAAGLILGSFLPWVTVRVSFAGSVSASGMEAGDGWITLIAGVIVAILAVRNVEPITVKMRNIFYGIGGCAGVVALINFGTVSNKISEVSDYTDSIATAHLGFGLYLLLASAVALIVGTWKLNTDA